MSEDLKALRALVKWHEWSKYCGACGSHVSCTHGNDCPIPSAEAALARLEAREAGRTQYDAFAEGFARAREQAARIRPGCASPVTLRAAIRAMEPDTNN